MAGIVFLDSLLYDSGDSSEFLIQSMISSLPQRLILILRGAQRPSPSNLFISRSTCSLNSFPQSRPLPSLYKHIHGCSWQEEEAAQLLSTIPTSLLQLVALCIYKVSVVFISNLSMLVRIAVDIMFCQLAVTYSYRM